MGEKTKTPELPRADWDFSTCPESELSFCTAYEYFRQIALVHRKRVGEKWTPKDFESAFDGYFGEGKRVDFQGTKDGQTADPFEINLAVKKSFAQVTANCTGFPDLPYLALNATEREAWIKTFGLDKLRPDRPTMAQVDYFEICLNPQEALKHYQYHCLEWGRQNFQQVNPPPDKSRRWIVDYDGFKFELGMVRINWSLSDKKLTKAFEKWLEKNRPASAKARETRGATKMSEMLKYLSALRLLQAMTAIEAGTFTQNIFGEPLYWDDANWYAASAKADVVMKQISSPFFDWAKNRQTGS
jgi:hypothetical protein